MPDASLPAEADSIFLRLIEEGVEFLVVGGQAEMLFGSPRMTYDTDICYRRTPENYVRLAKALAPLEPKLRGAPQGVPFRLDAATLAAGCKFTLDTKAGPLDLLGHVEPMAATSSCRRGARRTNIRG